KNLDNTTWFGNLSDIVDAVQGLKSGTVTEANLRTLRNPLLNVATGGVLTNRLRNAVDPVRRETRGLVDDWMNRVPGFSKSLPPVRDGYGDVVVPPKAMGGNWFGLLKPIVPAFRPFETDPVKQEGNRLQARVPVFRETLGGRVEPEHTIREQFQTDVTGIRLTPQQLDQRIRLYNDLVRDPEIGMKTLLNDPEYKNANKALQREMFTGVLRDMWQASGQMLLEKQPKLLQQLELKVERSAAPLLDEPAPPIQEPAPIQEQELLNLQRFDPRP
ncbi:MAG: hypothetical protein MN733_05590, partial [Nitrososphaera sp.]|nr:hypothetical protein [Nitrososphaera sp.]